MPALIVSSSVLPEGRLPGGAVLGWLLFPVASSVSVERLVLNGPVYFSCSWDLLGWYLFWMDACIKVGFLTVGFLLFVSIRLSVSYLLYSFASR